MLVGREPAKMRPSKDLTTCGRDCAGSSSVMARLPAGLSDVPEGQPAGRPEQLPGTPGDPSRRAGSQRAAQQETLPLLERDVHVGGAGATGATPGGPRPVERGCSGRAPTMMPAGGLPPECHAARLWKEKDPVLLPRSLGASLGTGPGASAGGQGRELADLPVAVRLDDVHLHGLRARLRAVRGDLALRPLGRGLLPAVHRRDDVLPEDDDGGGVLSVVDLLQADVEHLVAGRRRHLLVGVDDPALAEVLLVLVAEVPGEHVELALDAALRVLVVV